MTWSPDSLQDLSGKVYIVTGGNTGVGKATVYHLATHCAKVYMGARTQSKAMTAIKDIQRDVPKAQVEFLHVDMMTLSSVVSAANKIKVQETQLHGLVNNAYGCAI